MSYTPEFGIWKGIIERCTAPKSKYYQNYGGRGIYVCAQWRYSFKSFFADMGPRPSLGLSIERTDNNGPYSKDNCVWATRTQQGRNKRNNHLLTYQGNTKPISQWAQELGVLPVRIHNRLRYGFPIELVLEPRRMHRNQHSQLKYAKEEGL
jgi:hypothetical protein